MITRRGLIAATGSLGVAASLSACGGSGSGTGTSSKRPTGVEAAKQVTPTYVAFDKVKPDMAGDPKLGIPDGYYKFPATPPKITNYPLPKTEPMTFLTQGLPPGMGLAESSRFKQFTADVGNDMQVIFGGTTEYTAKFQTTMASNSLPTALMIINVPGLPKLLESKFVDLGEFIGGDKVKEFPGLASIPTTAWSIPMLNGRLWGVPQPRPPAGNIMSTRGDILAKRGIKKDQSPKDGAELLALMKEINNPSAGQFAMGAGPQQWLMKTMQEMTGTPNGWREEGGKFTFGYETEQFKEAMVHCAEFWKAGVLHPNSFSEPANNSTWWQSGVTAVYIQAFTNWLYFTQRQPTFDLGLIEIPKWSGGGLARKHGSPPGYNAYAAISKQSSPERVKEVLRVLDYIAAPFGTEEYLRFNYGVAGEHYDMVDGVPISTDKVKNEPTTPSYFGSQGLAYLTGPRDLIDKESAYLKKIMPTIDQDASAGLYSETALGAGATFTKKFDATMGDIIQGRAQMKAWDDLMSEWKTAAGNAMRKEYEEAFAAAKTK